MRIKSLSLFTDQLAAQHKFYTQQLGFNCIDINENSFTVAIGSSKLTFINNKECKPYHFAFNVPYASIEKALEWLKQKVDILRDGDNDIQEFENWQARAIYFYDEDKNIVEFIGRKTLNYDFDEPFDIPSVIEISEIGLASTDIESVYNSISSKVPLNVYDGAFDRFCAIGGETGLFICVDPEKKKWFPTDDAVFYSAFSVIVSNSDKEYAITYEDGTVSVVLH